VRTPTPQVIFQICAPRLRVESGGSSSSPRAFHPNIVEKERDRPENPFLWADDKSSGARGAGLPPPFLPLTCVRGMTEQSPSAPCMPFPPPSTHLSSSRQERKRAFQLPFVSPLLLLQRHVRAKREPATATAAAAEEEEHLSPSLSTWGEAGRTGFSGRRPTETYPPSSSSSLPACSFP